MFTQPLMYKTIAKHPTVDEIYTKQILEEGVFDKEQLGQLEAHIDRTFEEAYLKSKTHKFDLEDWTTPEWTKMRQNPQPGGRTIDTGVKADKIRELGTAISTLPKSGKWHRQIEKIFEARLESIVQGKGIDWGTAEALAFATLIHQDYHVRISGQDVERGTFSHRHAVVHDQDNDNEYVPISAICPKDGFRTFIACNSHLSEFAVLGYEYGYAQANPNTLTIWEAQFGDFANGAQTIVDQFISSGEQKWGVKNALVMLLPHGYDGNGPEHSSSRVERYLQMCDDNEKYPNDIQEQIAKTRKASMIVLNCSTAANYFHALRRQMVRNYRKPLVVVAPKKLLKLREACSDISEFEEGTRFTKVYSDSWSERVADNKVRRLVFCSG